MSSQATLLRYKAWADRVSFDFLANLPGECLSKPRPIRFGSVLRTLHHSYCMDRVWQAHLLGENHGYTSRNPEHCPEFPELRDAQQRIDQWYVEYASALDATALQQIISFEFIGGGDGRMSRGDILLHVANHTTYHRGHVAGMLYYDGLLPPTTDLPVFLRDAAKR